MSNIRSMFKVGDRVRVNLQTEQDLRLLQDGHGGWNQRMARFIGRVGTVHRTTENGDLRVRFEDSQIRWTFNPVALTKFPVEGDTVLVIDDMDRVKELQVNHGEWVESMREVLGKRGKVVKIYHDNDLRVTMNEGTPGQTFTLNPSCVVIIPNDNSSAATTTTTEAETATKSSSDVLRHRHHHVSAPAAGATTTAAAAGTPVVISSSSSSSGILMTRAPGSDGVNGEEVINRSSGGTTEITDLLRQVQLRDTKFKCSRGDGSASGAAGSAGVTSPHSVDAAAIHQSVAACPDVGHGHHHHHHHHAMHRSPASSSSRLSSHSSSPLTMATTGQPSPLMHLQHQQQHFSPAARPTPPVAVPDMPFPGQGETSAETVEMLKDKIRAIEDIIMCNICMESIKNVAFLCGHGSCSTCAQSLRSCHMCRLPITQRINLY